LIDPALQNNILEMVRNMGDLGVFLGMFLESSCVPIPSELIIIGAGAIGLPLLSIAIFGSLGATLGGMAGYCIGRFAAKPVLTKYGKFILIKPHHIEKAENFAKKYGVLSVLIGRIVPIVPFKVFSIAAGIAKINFPGFIIFTLIGVIPRIILLTIFGETLVKYTKPAVVVLAVGVIVFISYKLIAKKLK
jgi:membrane protein DedA with SNARE-associated domain